MLFTDRVERFVPPKRGRKHALRIVSQILLHRARAPRHEPRAAAHHPAPRASPARDRLRHQRLPRARSRPTQTPADARLAPPRRRPAGAARPARGRAAQRRPAGGEDPETGELGYVDTGDGACATPIRRTYSASRSSARQALQPARISTRSSSAGDDYAKALVAFFRVASADARMSRCSGWLACSSRSGSGRRRGCEPRRRRAGIGAQVGTGGRAPTTRRGASRRALHGQGEGQARPEGGLVDRARTRADPVQPPGSDATPAAGQRALTVDEPVLSRSRSSNSGRTPSPTSSFGRARPRAHRRSLLAARTGDQRRRDRRSEKTREARHPRPGPGADDHAAGC